MEMQVDYRLTLAEYLEAQRFTQAYVSLSRYGMLIAISGAAYFLMDTTVSWGPIIGLCVFGCVLVFATRLSVTMAYRRNPAMRGTIYALISEESMKVRNSVAATDYRWEAFTSFREGKRVFAIFQESGVCNILPKSAFQSEQVDELRNFLQERLRARTSELHLQQRRLKRILLLVVAVPSAVVLVMILLRRG